MEEMNKNDMFLVALMILKEAEMKLWGFVIKGKNKQLKDKYEQDW